MTLFKVRENIKRFFDNADISRTVGKCENIQGKGCPIYTSQSGFELVTPLEFGKKWVSRLALSQ